MKMKKRKKKINPLSRLKHAEAPFLSEWVFEMGYWKWLKNELSDKELRVVLSAFVIFLFSLLSFILYGLLFQHDHVLFLVSYVITLFFGITYSLYLVVIKLEEAE